MSQSKSDLTGKRILLAEDDPDLRTTIKSIFESKGATVVACENGLIAKNALGDKAGFDLLLSDIQMPELDGIQLLKIAKERYPRLKSLIFTGFSEYLETKSAAELGADGFLSKPFKVAELVSLAGELITGKVATAFSDKDFCRVGVDEFFSTTKLPSDIFVQLNETKFIRLAREGAEIDISRLQHIKDHRVNFLFVKTEDFHKYTGFNLKLANIVKSSSQVSEETKMRLFKHTSEMLIQQSFCRDVEKQTCLEAQAMLMNTVKAVSENENLLETLLSMQARSDDLYSHSLYVSVQACMIAKQMGWTSVASQQKVSLAALFHDIGFKELPDDIRMKPRFKMNSDEVKLYESHPLRGRNILQSIEGFPAELTAVIAQHHEYLNGTGYPLNLKSMKLHPLSKLIRLADEFVEKLSVLPEVKPDSAGTILNQMFDEQREEFDLDLLAAAFDLYKITRPIGLKNKAA